MNTLKANILINKIKKTTKALKISNQNKLNLLLHNTERNLTLQNLKNYTDSINDKIFLKKGNPFLFIRKNFTKLFSNILKRSFLTPNLIKFLHIAYWPKNDYIPWRMFFPIDPLEFKHEIRSPFISKYMYFFSLIFKKTNLYFFKNFISSEKKKKKYFKSLSYFYHLNMNNRVHLEPKSRYIVSKKNYLNRLKQNFLSKRNKQKLIKKKINEKINEFKNVIKFKYFKIPKFIMKDRRKKEFKNFFLLTFRQRSFLKNLINFYFPVISLTIKEMTIHSLPMKTKKPRRV